MAEIKIRDIKGSLGMNKQFEFAKEFVLKSNETAATSDGTYTVTYEGVSILQGRPIAIVKVAKNGSGSPGDKIFVPGSQSVEYPPDNFAIVTSVLKVNDNSEATLRVDKAKVMSGRDHSFDFVTLGDLSYPHPSNSGSAPIAFSSQIPTLSYYLNGNPNSSQANIHPGDSVTLDWRTTGFDKCYLRPNWSDPSTDIVVPVNGDRTFTPTGSEFNPFIYCYDYDTVQHIDGSKGLSFNAAWLVFIK